MKKRLIFGFVGKFLILESALMILPLIVGIIYGEYHGVNAFIITALITAFAGFLMHLATPENTELYAKEGLAIIGLVWVMWSLFGALPFFISREIPNYIDCVFETVSGFTTTGATILTDIESLSHCMHFWRSFTHWIGGMGVLIFAMAIIPVASKNSLHLMRAEVPGPAVSKLVPRGMSNAKILYGIYLGLCVLEFIFLVCGGMPVFDSIIHTFSTAGTGGFSCKAASIAAYNSPYIEWVITVFMFLFSINFNMYFFMLIGKFKNILHNSEWKVFTLIVVIATAMIALSTANLYTDISTNIRTSAFQVVAIISTTGFSTTDFDVWGGFAKMLILILMMIGACAGSTGGGLKVSRIMIMAKSAIKTIRDLVRPNSVSNIKIDGKTVDAETVKGVSGYFLVFIGAFTVSLFLVSLNNLNIDETVSAVTTCFNNIGPGLSSLGPTGNFHDISVLSKIVLSFDMLLGRLEMFPILLLFVPSIWKRKFI